MEPRTFSYTPASAHRAALAAVKVILPPLAVLVGTMTVKVGRLSVSVNLLVIATMATVAAYFILRQHFSTTKYTITASAITVSGYTLDRSQATHLEVTPAYLTLRAANRRPIRVRSELDDYPELLDILRSWNPPKVIYRDADLRRLALTYIPPTLSIAFLYYLSH